MSTDLLKSTTTPESVVDPFRLANKVVAEVSTAGARARVEAKRITWGGFGDAEVQRLAAVVQEAQRGDLSEEAYKSRLDEMVRNRVAA